MASIRLVDLRVMLIRRNGRWRVPHHHPQRPAPGLAVGRGRSCATPTGLVL